MPIEAIVDGVNGASIRRAYRRLLAAVALSLLALATIVLTIGIAPPATASAVDLFLRSRTP